MSKHNLIASAMVNLEAHDAEFEVYGRWLDVGPGLSIQLNLDNAIKLRDAAAEVVSYLSPKPDPLQWREEKMYSGTVFHLAYYGDFKRSSYRVRDNGTAYVYDYGDGDGEEKLHRSFDVVDEPAARRICEEIARGER